MTISLAWGSRSSCARRAGPKPHWSTTSLPRPLRASRQKGHAHGRGHEAQGHLVVGVGFNQQPALFNGLAKSNAGWGKAAAAGVGNLQFGHTPGTDQLVHTLSI